MWFFVFGAVICVGLVYYWWTNSYNYFKNRGIPGPNPKFPFGNTPSIITQKRNITYDVDDIYREFRGKAPFVGYYELKSSAYLLISPEAVKSVTVKNFKNFHDNTFSQFTNKDKDPIFGRNPFMLRGEEWKEKRAEITPAFTPSRIKALFPLVEEVLTRFTKYINDESKTSKPLDAREVCAKFTTDVVSSCIFNADAQSFTKDKPEIREMGRRLLSTTPFFTIMFVLYSLIPSLRNVYKIKFVPADVEEFFKNVMFQAIGHREKEKIKRDDYLAFLISLRNKKQITEMDMAAHGVTFFIDGFETSSNAITCALYELAANKTVQEKLRNEITEIFDEEGKIVYDKLIEHEYLDQVFHEALRLHPPAPLTNRECTEPIELECVKGKMVQFNKGDSLNIPIYSIHRDPDYYPEPEKFQPERFNPEHGGIKAFKDKGVFMPFGDGPRICLGMRFALMLSKSAIVQLVRNFEITVNRKTQKPLVMDPKEFLNVKAGGIWLDFKPLH